MPRATFTTDLRCAVAAAFPSMQCLVVPAVPQLHELRPALAEMQALQSTLTSFKEPLVE